MPRDPHAKESKPVVTSNPRTAPATTVAPAPEPDPVTVHRVGRRKSVVTIRLEHSVVTTRQRRLFRGWNLSKTTIEKR